MNVRLERRLGQVGRGLVAVTLALVALAVGVWPAHAEPPRPPILDKVGLDQKLNAQVPLDLVFRDEIWRSVKLSDYLTDGKPVILTLNYYNCKNTCSVILDDLVQKLGTMSFNIGEQYNIVSVSINPRETPQDAGRTKAAFEHRYPRPGVESSWHFLTGDQAAVEELADSVGFRYAYDEATGEYVHPDAIMLLTPDGHVSKYLFAPNYSGQDLRLGLVDSAQGKIGTLVDKVLLFCYQYDPTIGKYSLAILNTIRIAAVITFLLVAGFVIMMLRRDMRRPSHGV